MTTLLSVNTKGMMAKHQEALIEFARRILCHGEFLNEDEQADLSVRRESWSCSCTKVCFKANVFAIALAARRAQAPINQCSIDY